MGALCEVQLWGPCVRSSCGGPVQGRWGQTVELRLSKTKLQGPVQLHTSHMPKQGADMIKCLKLLVKVGYEMDVQKMVFL